MKTNYQVRYAAHPEDAKSYDTERLRRDFLIENVFTANEVNMVYSMYDRMVVGGAMPVGEALPLEAIDPLKAPYFLTRREIGIFNVGGAGTVRVGDESFHLDFKEALYLGSGERDVILRVTMLLLPQNSTSTPLRLIATTPTAKSPKQMPSWLRWAHWRAQTTATSTR